MTLPDRPAPRVITPTTVTRPYDLEPVPPAPLDLPPGAEVRIVEYRQYAGGLVPIYEVQQRIEPTPPRDLKPGPLLDPAAQRLLAGGIGGGALAAGVGWGVAQILGQIAGLGTGGLLALALLIAAARWAGRARTTNITIHQTATGMFGRNHQTTERTGK